MDTYTSPAPASDDHPLRWRTALWLTALLVASPLATAAHDETETTATANVNTQLISGASTSGVSDEAQRSIHAKDFCWDAPAEQIPAVILWDESGNVHRTVSGQPNVQPSGATVTASMNIEQNLYLRHGAGHPDHRQKTICRGAERHGVAVIITDFDRNSILFNPPEPLTVRNLDNTFSPLRNAELLEFGFAQRYLLRTSCSAFILERE